MNSSENPLRLAWIAGQRACWPGLTTAPVKKGRGTDMTHGRDLRTGPGHFQERGVTLLDHPTEQDEMRRWHLHDCHRGAARLGLPVRRHPRADAPSPTTLHFTPWRRRCTPACKLRGAAPSTAWAAALKRSAQAGQPRYVETYARTHVQ